MIEEADNSVRVEFNEFGGRGGHNAACVVSVVSAGGRGRCTGTGPLDSCISCTVACPGGCGYTHLVKCPQKQPQHPQQPSNNAMFFLVFPLCPHERFKRAVSGGFGEGHVAKNAWCEACSVDDDFLLQQNDEVTRGQLLPRLFGGCPFRVRGRGGNRHGGCFCLAR